MNLVGLKRIFLDGNHNAFTAAHTATASGIYLAELELP